MALDEQDKRWIAEQLDEQIGQLQEQFSIRLEKVETTLLTELHKWASPLEARQRTHAAALKQWLDQPQFQTGPIGVRVQHGPKLPPL